jgi:hypothetical protein
MPASKGIARVSISDTRSRDYADRLYRTSGGDGAGSKGRFYLRPRLPGVAPDHDRRVMSQIASKMVNNRAADYFNGFIIQRIYLPAIPLIPSVPNNFARRSLASTTAPCN